MHELFIEIYGKIYNKFHRRTERKIQNVVKKIERLQALEIWLVHYHGTCFAEDIAAVNVVEYPELSIRWYS